MKYLWILLLTIPLFGQTTYTEAEALEMIKQRDAQWENKLSKLESIDSVKTIQIGQYEELIGELVTLSKTDSTLLSKKDEQIKSLKEQNEANEELAKLAKPSWYENKWLYFTYGAAAVIIPTYFGIQIADLAN